MKCFWLIYKEVLDSAGRILWEVCSDLTFAKILEFLWNPPFELHFSFLSLLLFLRGSFGFGFCHLYRFLRLKKDRKLIKSKSIPYMYDDQAI